MKCSFLRFRIGPVLVGLVLLSMVSTSQAINFNLVYLDPATDSRSKPPKSDLSGDKLQAIVEHAAAEWAGIVQDNHTMELRYFYGDETSVPSMTANAPRITATPDGRRVVVGELRFYNNSDWYLDLTPSTDSEFDMSATLLGDLSASDQAAGYVQGAVPIPQLEVGHRGQTNDPALFNTIDLLATARHEIGHHMGVAGAPELPYVSTEAADHDYDFPSSLIGGKTGAVKVFGANESPPQILEFHFDAADPLMSGQTTARGIRRGITETDVYAAAAVGNWTQIDLPRKTYYGLNTTYSDAANWSGRRVPSASDTVSIRHGGFVGLASDERVGTLLVGADSTLNTNSRQMNVQGEAVIGVGLGDDSELIVGPAGRLGARRVVVDGGALTLSGGQVVTGQGSVINDQGVVQGRGSISFDVLFDNQGTLRANGGTLSLESSFGSGRLDLDGSGTGGGSIEALTGSLDVNVGLVVAAGDAAATYKATMTIGPGRFVEVSDPVHLLPGSLRDPFGTIILDGTASQTASFRGTELISQGLINADRLAEIDADVRLRTSSTTAVPQSNDRLTFTQNLTLEGGSIVGDGTALIEGRAELDSGSVEVGELILAGESILDGASVRVPTIDASADGLSQNSGMLAFGKFTGKLVQQGGVLDLTFVEEGAASLIGSLQQGPSAEIMLTIAGLDDFDQLMVSESAVVDGVLNVALADGYDPLGGEQFPVLVADGGLDIESLALTGPDADRFEIDIQGDTILLEAISYLAGDYNGDGLVDAADYTVWRDGSLDADGNNDGQVNAADYSLWAGNYGASRPSNSTSVPEPCGLVLFALGVAACYRRR